MENKKMVVVGVMVVAAIGGVALLMKNKSDKAEALALARKTPIDFDRMRDESNIVTQSTPGDYGGISPSDTFIRQIDVKNSNNKEWVGINSRSRTKASATLEIGDQGMINGQIPCTITSFYIDKNGKKGAFKCEGQDYYEIPGGSRFEW